MGNDFRPHEIVWTPPKVARFWDYYGANPAYMSQSFSFHSGKAILKYAKKHISFSDRRVLDFGCGPGFLLGHLLRKGIPCEGLEFSGEFTEEVRTKFKDSRLFRGVIQVEKLPVPIPDEEVDIVFLVEVLEHLLEDQLNPTMHEVRRILKRGGNIIVTVPNEEYLESNKIICPECGCVFHRWQHQRSLTAHNLEALLYGFGFSAVICKGVFFGLHPLRMIVGRAYRKARRIPEPVPHLIYIGRRT